jgi:hypothetical protein
MPQRLEDVQHRFMRKLCSPPRDMEQRCMGRRSVSLNDIHQLTKPEENISGCCLIRAEPDSPKVMCVEFVGTGTGLEINLLQLVHNEMQVFQLARLSYTNLAVCWEWENNDMFVLGALQDTILCHDICCWPQGISRNKWLDFFESKHTRTMTVREAVFARGVFRRQRRISSLSPISEVDIPATEHLSRAMQSHPRAEVPAATSERV